MRTNLKVPYAEKDEARNRGARWDAARKTWYVENVENMAQFLRWTPAYLNRPANAILGMTQKAVAKPNATTEKPVGRNKRQTAVRRNESRIIVGPKHFNTRCDCKPWCPCPSCMENVAAAYWGVSA